jgi:hypothetical protein
MNEVQTREISMRRFARSPAPVATTAVRAVQAPVDRSSPETRGTHAPHAGLDSAQGVLAPLHA